MLGSLVLQFANYFRFRHINFSTCFINRFGFLLSNPLLLSFVIPHIKLSNEMSFPASITPDFALEGCNCHIANLIRSVTATLESEVMAALAGKDVSADRCI